MDKLSGFGAFLQMKDAKGKTKTAERNERRADERVNRKRGDILEAEEQNNGEARSSPDRIPPENVFFRQMRRKMKKRKAVCV